jgi:hypothetical protein
MVIYPGPGYLHLFGYNIPVYIMSADDFAWAIRVTRIGKSAIVGIVVQAHSSTSISYSVGFAGDLWVGGTDSPSCYDLGGHNGFYAGGLTATAYFICGNHPLVTPVSTYWYGHYSQASYNIWNQGSSDAYYSDSGMAVSWQGKTLPAGGRAAHTMFIRWASSSSPPTLDLYSAYRTGSDLLLSGSVIGSANWISVYAAFDGNYAELAAVALERASGSSFNTYIPLSTWYLTSGSHTLSVFAVDDFGMVSSIETRTIDLDYSYGSSSMSDSGNDFYGTATPYDWSPYTWISESRTPTLDGSWSPSPEDEIGSEGFLVIALILIGILIAIVAICACCYCACRQCGSRPSAQVQPEKRRQQAPTAL